MTRFIRQISKALALHYHMAGRYAEQSSDVTRGQLFKRHWFSTPSNMAASDTHESLIGKPAPKFTLPNYDGESFTFVPGEKDIPTAIFVYPAAGRVFLGVF
jgi:hypothetical protein